MAPRGSIHRRAGRGQALAVVTCVQNGVAALALCAAAAARALEEPVAGSTTSPGSLGNGLGIGLADTTTRRFAQPFDPVSTWVDLLTASEPGVLNTLEGKLPLVLPCDRDAIEVALHSSLAQDE
jgi:hypothetical protein